MTNADDEDFDYTTIGPEAWMSEEERKSLRKLEEAEKERASKEREKRKLVRERAIAPHKHRIPSHKKRKRLKRSHIPATRPTGGVGGKGTYGRLSANYKAIRKARQYIGLASRARPSVEESRLCPPFVKSFTTEKWDLQTAAEGVDMKTGEVLEEHKQGKERLYCQDIDAVIARKYWSMFALGNRTRPRRQSEDGWGGLETDWILWELFAHLTFGNDIVDPKPWFVSKWIEKYGMSEKFLRMGGPCSSECSNILRRGEDDYFWTHSPPNVIIEGMLEVMAHEGIDVPLGSGIPESASEIYQATVSGLDGLGKVSLCLGGDELDFHIGVLLWADLDVREEWHTVISMGESASSAFGNLSWDEGNQILTLFDSDENGIESTQYLDFRKFTASKEWVDEEGVKQSVEWNLDNGDEWWDEAEYTPYRMRHIPVAFSIMQALFEARMHRSEPYAYLRAVLESEVSHYTSLGWDDACAEWSSAMQGSGRVAWCDY